MPGIVATYYGPRAAIFRQDIRIIAMLVVVVASVSCAAEDVGVRGCGVRRPRSCCLAAATFPAAVANREPARFRRSAASPGPGDLGEGTPATRSGATSSSAVSHAPKAEIEQPWVRRRLNPRGAAISAASASASNAEHHKTIIHGVKQPPISRLASLQQEDAVVLYSPADTPWLKADECFVASVVTFEQLTVGGSWKQYMSSWELITGLWNQSIEPGADVRVILHSRLMRPSLCFVVLLGLLVLARNSRNIFWRLGCAGRQWPSIPAVLRAGLGPNYLLDPRLAIRCRWQWHRSRTRSPGHLGLSGAASCLLIVRILPIPAGKMPATRCRRARR
jgi:hypothetical protein